MTVLRSGSATDVGRVRTVNEDLALDGVSLFAVADGMGGHAGGEVASRVAIEVLQRHFTRDASPSGLVDAVREANHAVWDRSRTDPDVRGMGTTMTAVALVAGEHGDRLVMANVGDSRGYRYRDGELVQLTMDHSVAEELVARGELSEAEAAVHPHRHILTRALGVGPDVDVDAWELDPREGDRYLLCSDGLSNEVSPDRIAAVLERRLDPEETAGTLVRLANEHGGNDNITVVVVDVIVGDPPGGGEDGDGVRRLQALAGVVAYAGAPARAAGATTTGTGAAPGRGVAPEGRAPTARAADGLLAPATGAGLDLTSSQRSVGAAASPGTAREVEAPAAPEAPSAPGERVEPVVRPGRGAETPAASPARRPRGTRLITFRSILFVLLLGGVGYGLYSVVRWYIDNSYYVKLAPVTVDGKAVQQIVIYQGRQGGFLWLKPKVARQTGVTTTQVPSDFLGALEAGVEKPSLAAANAYVHGLVCLQLQFTLANPEPPGCASATTPSTSTTGPATTSTVPGATATTAKPGTAAPARRRAPVPAAGAGRMGGWAA